MASRPVTAEGLQEPQGCIDSRGRRGPQRQCQRTPPDWQSPRLRPGKGCDPRIAAQRVFQKFPVQPRPGGRTEGATTPRGIGGMRRGGLVLGRKKDCVCGGGYVHKQLFIERKRCYQGRWRGVNPENKDFGIFFEAAPRGTEHAHEPGAPARNLQEAMGYTQLETTMRYLTPSAAGVRSPLDCLWLQVQRPLRGATRPARGSGGFRCAPPPANFHCPSGTQAGTRPGMSRATRRGRRNIDEPSRVKKELACISHTLG